MTPEQLILKAAEEPLGLKVQTSDPKKLQQQLSALVRRLKFRMSVLVPAHVDNQVWLMPKRGNNGEERKPKLDIKL